MDLGSSPTRNFTTAVQGKTVRIDGLPLLSDAESVKEFLERLTGDGSVQAIKLRPPKVIRLNSWSFAIVQFVKDEYAREIELIVQHGLSYQGSPLGIQLMERDIIPRPRTAMFTESDITLYLGCPLSNQRFSYLWSSRGVIVEFGFKMRKLDFFLSFEGKSYKLVLSYESIWEMKLIRSRSRKTQFLIIQLAAAPRIFEKTFAMSHSIYDDPSFNYSKDTPDDQWIRTVDFTPSCSIGHAAAYCLRLPYDRKLPNIMESFVYYKETDGFLNMEIGHPFSRSLDLVPIFKLKPSQLIDVPYRILFKINHMVQNGTLMGPTLDDTFFRLVSPGNVSRSHIELALERMSHLKSSCLDPVDWLRRQYSQFQGSKRWPTSPTISLDSGLVFVHKVHVTPSKIYFYGPEINVSNRVIRHFYSDIDNFLRVSFVDEDGEKMRSTALSRRSESGKHTTIYSRVLSTLQNGIVIGGKRFRFLAFSSSQLRENSTWMFASRKGLTTSDIRRWMGDFYKIKNVAKYAARLGQSFSSSTETLNVSRAEVEIIPDVEHGRYIFSDGIGKISSDFAKRVALKCGLSGTPSAFQIRYGGYKGVVAIDPTSSKKLSLRKSMSKYDSNNTGLDVLAYSKYQPCFLNRQLITLLSTLGISDHIFEKKQDEAIEKLNKILTDSDAALEALGIMSPGETTNVVREMLLCGYKPDAEPFLAMSLQAFRASKLFELRTRSRIFLPKGRAMMGCLDETRTLNYGQVFVQVSCPRTSFYDNGLSRSYGIEACQRQVVLKRRVIVAKNPCLHPGDVRILSAIDITDLHHMVDCVVFPQKGERPHPDECSGSDLDGDIYFVSWDEELLPSHEEEPMAYNPAPIINQDGYVSIKQVEEYFTNYLVNDSLGIIANAHTVFADQSPFKAKCSQCLTLARLFSIAVDFPKTGIPAQIDPSLYVKNYPDFMEKLDKTTYESDGVIGKMFRAIKDHAPRSALMKAFTKEVACHCYDPDMEVDGFEDYLEDALHCKEEYDFKLGNLMDHYGIKTEAEILSGNILKMSRNFTKNKDGEDIRLAVKSLRKETRGWFKERGFYGGAEDDFYPKASAWYYVTYNAEYWGLSNSGMERPHFLSFPWCVYDTLIKIKQNTVNRRRRDDARINSLTCRMRRQTLL